MKNNLSLEKLRQCLAKYPAFRTRQVLEAVFKCFCGSYSEISVLPLQIRQNLEDKLEWTAFKKTEIFHSKDSLTHKTRITLKDGNIIESVLMPNAKGNYTICVSTQAGCAVRCAFCATGMYGFKRNLDPLEITEQYCFWKKRIQDSDIADKRISNIVYMGMGEPLFNYEAVKQSLRLILEYSDIGQGNITVSTAGPLKQLEKILTDKEWPEVKFAISIHSADSATREKLVPFKEKDYLEKLRKWCEDYLKNFGARNRPLTFEYILIKDINDSMRQADKLIRFLSGLGRVKVNLIPFNSHDFAEFRPPERNTLLNFQKKLKNKGIFTTIRKSMGQDIKAACGQLAAGGKGEGMEGRG